MYTCPCSDIHGKILDQMGLAGISLHGVKEFIFSKGEALCNEGISLQYLFKIVNGSAKICTRVSNGKTLLINFARPGDILGDVELMTGKREATTTVQAVSEIRCIGIPLDINSVTLRASAPFLSVVGSGLAKKLTSSSKNSTVNILVPLEERLCSYIQMTHEQGWFRENLITVAELLGISYRHLLRSLRSLTDKDILKKERDGYHIVSFTALQQMAREFYLYD